jgi:hypothetical protein
MATVEWVANERECLAHTEPGLKGQSAGPNTPAKRNSSKDSPYLPEERPAA